MNLYEVSLGVGLMILCAVYFAWSENGPRQMGYLVWAVREVIIPLCYLALWFIGFYLIITGV